MTTESENLSIVTTNNITIIGDRWEVQYARYYNRPSSHSSSRTLHPSLVQTARKGDKSGTWLSSFSSLAHLTLLTTDDHHADALRSLILTVTLLGNVVEEHYISKLHFTWPQVSCMSGYPPRGSKVVFMSYKDQVGQNQRFVVRFLSNDETERFMNFMKEMFGHDMIDGSISGIAKSKTSLQSEIIPRSTLDWDPITSSANCSQDVYRPTRDWSIVATSADNYIEPVLSIENHDSCQNSNPLEATLSQDVQNHSAFPPSFTTSSVDYSQDSYRPIQDWSPITSSVDTYIQPMHPSENHNASESSNSLETTLSQDVQKLSAFPPSFTSLLMNCYPVTEQATQSTLPDEVNLKNEIMKYLHDSSFQDMLSKVQKVVSEFEGDLLM